ncbi:MAG: CNNM domain-containing protein [Thaumarchaeota archaeon]|nr:CNNM domain-containing protein [Nitrososphaerota archaeon]
MADWIVYVFLGVAIAVSFWASLLEATYLSVRPLSLMSASTAGNPNAAKAVQITSEKTKLVSSTTLLSTFADTTLASSVGLILSGAFGTVGWVVGTVICSLIIMVLLNLLPKAIGIENSVRMAIFLAPSSKVLLNVLSPLALPMTAMSRSLSQRIVGKPAYDEEDLVDEFENLLMMLEKAGNIQPDAGRILRSALASSKTTAADVLTPINEIVAIKVGSDVREALALMGKSKHPHLPVYDAKKKTYEGAVTFRSVFGALASGRFGDKITDHMVQPARVDLDQTAATIMDKMQSAGVTMAFISEGGKIVGMVTLTDILEIILGMKSSANPLP